MTAQELVLLLPHFTKGEVRLTKGEVILPRITPMEMCWQNHDLQMNNLETLRDGGSLAQVSPQHRV